MTIGSSRGRGTRAAGWFDDLIKEKGQQSMKSLVLLEGIAGWAAAGKEYTDMMDGYEEELWEKK
jgi:arsenical-resistance protein 2